MIVNYEYGVPGESPENEWKSDGLPAEGFRSPRIFCSLSLYSIFERTFLDHSPLGIFHAVHDDEGIRVDLFDFGVEFA